ncbi:hypothetical protein BDL97_14G017100 [Sphagnum fallax]|nr:hypothetical protein BDL97_14G017100 [Sphagnum fallax]
MEAVMSRNSSSSLWLSSTWSVQSLAARLSRRPAQQLPFGVLATGRECIAPIAALQQQGDVPLSWGEQKLNAMKAREKLANKKKPSKLHRGWHPGQRTRAPDPVEKKPAQTDKRQNELFSGRFLFKDDDGEDIWSDDGDDEEEEEEDEDTQEDKELESMPEMMQTKDKSSQVLTTDLDCQHFTQCSGCVLDTNLDQPPVMEEVTEFFLKQGVADFTLESGNLWEWRCRAKLAVRGTSMDPQIGLFEEGSHFVVDIPSCRAHHPSINATIKLVKEAIQELGIQPYNEDLHLGELRYVQMVVTTFNTTLPAAERYASGKVQVSLVWNARDEDSIQADCLNKMAEIIFGGRWRHILGESELWERMSGVDISFTPASFGQANLQVFDVLLRRLQKAVKIGSSVVELYAGVGLIGLSLATTRKCRTVKCVEVNKEARLSFEQSLSRLPASVNSNISWHCADASVSPIKWLEGANVVIVDPPRKGLDPPVIEALRTASLRGLGKTKSPSSKTTDKVEKRPWMLRAKQGAVHKESASNWEEEEHTWPDTLIYVSCGWQAFKLDYAALVEGDAWYLDDAKAFNLFPGTNSIEVLAIFKRGKKPPKVVKKGSGVRSKSAKSLQWTRAGKRLALGNSKQS